MPAISQKRTRKPSVQGRTPVTKLLRLDRAELKKLEHAARHSTPPLTVSYYILKGALEKAEREAQMRETA